MDTVATPAPSEKRFVPLGDHSNLALLTPAHLWGSSSPAAAKLSSRTSPSTCKDQLPTPQTATSKTPSIQLFIGLRPRQTLYIGRKCPTPAPYEMDAFVSLPPSAKHASRLHAKVYLTHAHEVRFEVLGQNGVDIKRHKYRAGQVYSARLYRGSVLTVDFYGCLVLLEFEMPTRLPSPPPLLRCPLPARRLAPPMLKADIVSEPSAADEARRDDSQDDSQDVSLYPPLTESAALSGIDLLGTLASTLVFQSRATLSTAELAQLAVETCSALARLPGWNSETHLERFLAKCPFGCIDSAGIRDASGRHIQKQWFYRPDLDPDVERAENLKPFAKAPRASQRGAAKQYFWPMPSIKRRRL